MRKKALLFLWMLTPAMGWALETLRQDSLSTPVYYEALADDRFVFYFDESYYLSDKHCEFTAIERIGHFDFAKAHFEGDFQDYNNQGKLILSGQYKHGQKDGLFRAYHFNGRVKWEGIYVDDLPHGDWNYYYPDGKPMLHIKYDSDSTMRIWSYWDVRGRERVKDGNGRYVMKIEIDGYSEYGAVFVERTGRVRAGSPIGDWTLEWVDEDGSKEVIGTEYYRNGLPEVNPEFDRIIRGEARHALVPLNFFLRAEEMRGKPCSIDHQSGFIDYLTQHIEEWFEDYSDDEIVPQGLTYRIYLQKDGSVSEIVPEHTFQRSRAAQRLMQALQTVGFWLPSYLDGEFIDDELTLSLRVFPDRENNKLLFFDVGISRAKGF